MINNVLLVYVPSRRGKGEGILPLGLLYVGGVLERLNKNVKILDLYLYDLSSKNNYGYSILKETVNGFKPDIIGFGGIATSFPMTKQLSLKLRQDFPDIFQIAGAALSSVYDLLLTRTAVQVVFHGETETNMQIFINRLDNKEMYSDIPGISFFGNNIVKRNPPVPQIRNLDEIPFPPYHLVNVADYATSKQSLVDTYKDDAIDQGVYENVVYKTEGIDNFIEIVTSRGCTHRCSFCFRQTTGYRKHSVDYVINHIKYIIENYGINGFTIVDELFNGNVKWVFDLCDAIEKNNLKIAYRASARVDNVSEKMLQRMYETGCYSLFYGQESGSVAILKEYKKGVTREQNIKATLMTKKAGIYSTLQLVIGSPSETRETIDETIDFMRILNVQRYSLNYLIPFPGTPVWQYVIENNLIRDVEDFLVRVATEGGWKIVNLTKVSDKEWRNWPNLIKYEVRRNHKKHSGKFRDVFMLYVEYQLRNILPDEIIRKLKSGRAIYWKILMKLKLKEKHMRL